MRTLKKTLSLVLVLAMVCSCFVMGTSAAFEDADEITAKYAEAIDVMNALKILQGSDGNFDPQGTLTRAQAARIIVAMLQAEDYAKVATCTFTDVATTDWFYDEIAYCQSIGLMKGYGDGTVGPNDELTGPAFALMVMKAAGIDTSSVNPATYALDVVTLASKLGLATVAELTSEPFTREVAAGLSFAGLQHGVVVENTATSNIRVFEIVALSPAFVTENAALVGTRHNTFAAANKAVADTEEDHIVYGTDYTIESVDLVVEDTYYTYEDTLAENFDLAPAYFYDSYGVMNKVWTVEGEAITAPAIVDALVGTYGDGAKYADIAKDLGLTLKSEASFIAYTNGALTDYAEAKTLVESKATVPANTTLTIYKDIDGDFTFSYVEETLVQATVAATPVASGENKGLYAWNFGGTTIYDAKDAYTHEAYYLVVANNDSETNTKTPFLSIEVPESVVGKVTTKDAKNAYVIVGGEKLTTVGTSLVSVALKGEYTFYFNSNGQVIGAVAVVAGPAPVTLLYVVDHYAVFTKAVDPEKDKFGNTIANTGADSYTCVYAQCVTMEGEVVEYLVNKTTKTTDGQITGAESTYTAYEKQIVKLGAATAGVYAIEAATGYAVAADNYTDLSKTAVSFTDNTNTYYYDAAEYICVIDEHADIKVVDGKLADAVDSLEDAWVVYTGKDTETNKTVATVIYWLATAPAAAYEGGIIYAVSSDCDLTSVGVDKDGKEATVYTWTVYLDGVKTEITTLVDGALTAGTFYTYAVDTAGHYTFKAITNSESPAYNKTIGVYNEEITNVYGKYITTSTLGANYDVTGVTVVDLRANGDGKLEKGDFIYALYSLNAQSQKVVSIIYIVG